MFNSKSQFVIIPEKVDLSASAADKFTFKSRHPMVIHSVEFVASVEAVGDATTAAVVSFDVTPVGGSRTEIATATLDNLALGITTKLLDSNSEFAPYDIANGDILHFEHKTAASGGTTTGEGHFIVYYEMAQDFEVA